MEESFTKPPPPFSNPVETPNKVQNLSTPSVGEGGGREGVWIKNGSTENESKVSAFFLTHSMDPMYQKKIQPEKQKVIQLNNTHNIIIIERLGFWAVGISGD